MARRSTVSYIYGKAFYGETSGELRVNGHNYICRNYIGHNYIGHNCIGHNNYVGETSGELRINGQVASISGSRMIHISLSYDRSILVAINNRYFGETAA